MGTEIKRAKYILSDVDRNNNKFWEITQYDDNSCLVVWGRVGDRGQSKRQQFGAPTLADRFFQTKCREKEKKGYEHQRTIGAHVGTHAPAMPAPTEIKRVAAAEIATDPLTTKLVERLVEANVHNILSAVDSSVTYDASRGTFSTPLGPIDQSAIDDARSTLISMAPFVEAADFRNRAYIQLINHYLRVVPQKVGRKLDPETLYPDLAAIQNQNQTLDALEASLKMATAPPDGAADPAPRPRTFEARLALVETGKIIDRLKKFYKSTWQAVHQSSSLDVKTVYEVEISGMARAFDEDGAKLDNIWELWHGTKTANLLSIIKSGFLLPGRTPGAVTGAMFGRGIYASDQSTKSLNYASGYWSGRRDSNCFMFLIDMAMGTYYVPPHSMSNLPKPGYDSTFAKGRESGVMNNEMIVYRTSQVRPKFLVEFSPGGK